MKKEAGMAKKKILIIDDEVSFTQMVKINLEDTGRFEVMMVNDPKQALSMARHYKPDVVLLDVIMPGVDGGDIAYQMKEDQALAAVPVIFLTAVVKEEETDSGEGNIGGHSFLAKPVTLKKLLECIDKHL